MCPGARESRAGARADDLRPEAGFYVLTGMELWNFNNNSIVGVQHVTVPGSATVMVCLGACQAPAGPPGSRDVALGMYFRCNTCVRETEPSRIMAHITP